MPRRPRLRDRLGEEPQGREAVYGVPTTTNGHGDQGGGDSWEASNRRVTFYCPEELLAAIEREVRRSGRSKTRVIVEAVREHLEARQGL